MITHCPRCGKEWKNIGRSGNAQGGNISNTCGIVSGGGCGLQYYSPSGKDDDANVSFVFGDTCEDPQLYWPSQGNAASRYPYEKDVCVYHPGGNRRSITLPRLPYTITKEDLDRYLALI